VKFPSPKEYSSEAQVHFTDLQISFGKLIGLVGHHFVSVFLGDLCGVEITRCLHTCWHSKDLPRHMSVYRVSSYKSGLADIGQHGLVEGV
jgi:hypothetical protein